MNKFIVKTTSEFRFTMFTQNKKAFENVFVTSPNISIHSIALLRSIIRALQIISYAL